MPLTPRNGMPAIKPGWRARNLGGAPFAVMAVTAGMLLVVSPTLAQAPVHPQAEFSGLGRAAGSLGPSALLSDPSAMSLRYGLKARARLQTSARPASRPAGTRPLPRPAPESIQVTETEPAAIERQADYGNSQSEGISERPDDVGDNPAPIQTNDEVHVDSSSIVLRTADVDAESFPALRQHGLGTIADPEARTEDLLEHARVLLAGLFLPEAMRSVGDARSRLEGEGGELERLADEISAAIEGLGGAASTGRAADGPLWHVLQLSKRGQVLKEGEIRAAAADLQFQSSAVVSSALPTLVGAAIDAGQTGIAGDLIGAGETSGSLTGAELGLARGRLAAAHGDDEAAFDHLAGAMVGVGEAGVQARLELVDLSRERSGDVGLEELRDILVGGIAQWRNDDLARNMMARLAAVTEDLGDRPSALSVMARIMTDYPESDEADLARRRAPLLLTQMANEARDGRMDVEEFILSMRDLENALSGDLPWITVRRDLAEILAGQGLREAAIAEYREMLDDIAQGSPASRRLQADIHMREAELLLEAGRFVEARAALQTSGTDQLGSSQRHDALIMQLDVLTEGSALLAGLDTDEDGTLLRARHALVTDRPGVAAARYEDHADGDNGLPRADLARYILANAEADRSGALAPGAEETHDHHDLYSVAAALGAAAVGTERLSSSAAEETLAKSAENLGAIGRLLGLPANDASE